jgi:hypothetical protein
MPEETYTPLFSQSNRNMGVAASDSNPRFGWYFRGSTTDNGGIYWGTFYAMNNYLNPKAAIRAKLTLNCGSANYIRKNTNASYNYDATGSSPATWTSQYDIALFYLQSNAATYYYGKGTIYRVEISEDNVALFNYVPCKRVSDDVAGLYDTVNGTYIQASAYLLPFILTTRNYTNCSATLLSASTTGTAARAVIGSTWSIKITPTSGYTFTGGTTPQVEIDGVDVTSTTVTDNGDGTYTVTIVDVPDKPIEITAACVADPNAVQSNSLLTGTPTNTPDEPMGDNSDEEEM